MVLSVRRRFLRTWLCLYVPYVHLHSSARIVCFWITEEWSCNRRAVVSSKIELMHYYSVGVHSFDCKGTSLWPFHVSRRHSPIFTTALFSLVIIGILTSVVNL